MSNQKVIGPLRRVAAVKRHGKHEGQAGVEGQKGGSAPGFTHVGATPEGEGGGAGEATAAAMESLKSLDLESSFSLVGSVAGKVIFVGPEGHTKVFDVETGRWEHSGENASALLQALEEAESPLLGQLIKDEGGEVPLRSGNVSLVDYADTELSTKRMVNEIMDAGFGLTGKDYPGVGDNAYIFNLMAQLNPAIRAEEYSVDDQLTLIHQSKLKIILDAIEYEAERSGLKTGDDLAAVMALNATLEYPDFKEVTGQDWDPHDDFILDGINEEFQRRMVMEVWVRTNSEDKSLAVIAGQAIISDPDETLRPSYGLDPGVIQEWTTVNNLSKETSEALYQNYLTRFSTPGTAEHKYRFEGELPFDALNNVILDDKYSWVPRDEGPKLEQAASYMNRGWQITTSSPEAIVLTEVVAEQHGGTSIPRSNFDEDQYRTSADSLGPDAFRDIRFSNDTAEIATDIYARTQQQLADSGLKRTDTVRLYRGMDKSGDESTWNPSDVQEGLVEVEMYSLSSWTPSPSVAARFSGDGWMIAADIPVQRLWANADTGPPSKGEQEWMVLGMNGIQGAIVSDARTEEITNASSLSFGGALDKYFDSALAEKAERPTISPDLTHMMWITTLIENETGLDSTKVPVKDVRDAELVAEQDAEIVAETEEGLDVIERHLAPIHPGTGTDQSVHAGGGGGGVVTESPELRKWSPDLLSRVMDFTAQRYEKLPASETTAPFQYGAVWLLPDGQIIRVGDAHENYRKVLFKEFGGEDFPGRQADFREVGSKEIRKQGFVRVGYIPNTYRGERSIYFDLDLKAITPTTKQAMRDIFWSVHTVERGPPNVTFDWRDDDGKYQSFTTTDAGGGEAGTLRELRRAIGFKIDRSLIQRHYGPGPHPGTGTDQSIHAGGATGELHGGKVTPMDPARQKSLKDYLSRFAIHGTYPVGFPEGKYPIIDPDNFGLAWLEGKDAILRYIETSAREYPVETADVIDENGNLVMHTVGDGSSIRLSINDLGSIKWAIEQGHKVTFTHNHPGFFAEGEKPMSIPPSYNDVRTSLMHGMDEIRATSVDGIYSMKFNWVKETHDGQRVADVSGIMATYDFAQERFSDDLGATPSLRKVDRNAFLRLHMQAREQAWQYVEETYPDFIDYSFEEIKWADA